MLQRTIDALEQRIRDLRRQHRYDLLPAAFSELWARVKDLLDEQEARDGAPGTIHGNRLVLGTNPHH